MRVLVVGSGGREHALCWKIAKSDLVKKLYCAPGNGGTDSVAEPVDISSTSIDKLVDYASHEKIDLTVVGPEVPLYHGIVDAFQMANLRIFGPNKACSMVEGSKAFAKNLLRKYGIPTPNFKVFDNPKQALNFSKNSGFPTVIKADGLAGGKGVIICYNEKEASEAIKSIMVDRIFDKSGEKIVIEEFCSGTEVSIMAFVDGKTIVVIEPSQDYKRLYENDKGPNTGGMGSYSPVPVVSREDYQKIISKILSPFVYAMNRSDLTYRGILYAGIIITKSGPKVLEFNSRFGDPETQVVLTRLKSDIIPLMNATIDGTLDELKDGDITWDSRVSLCTVLVSGGYPSKYETGYEIKGLHDAISDDVFVFHAGTIKSDNKEITAGGRVINVVALADDYRSAKERVYSAINKISFKNMYFRKDIGSRVANLTQAAKT